MFRNILEKMHSDCSVRDRKLVPDKATKKGKQHLMRLFFSFISCCNWLTGSHIEPKNYMSHQTAYRLANVWSRHADISMPKFNGIREARKHLNALARRQGDKENNEKEACSRESRCFPCIESHLTLIHNWRKVRHDSVKSTTIYY